jgi:hypothetical protein
MEPLTRVALAESIAAAGRGEYELAAWLARELDENGGQDTRNPARRGPWRAGEGNT